MQHLKLEQEGESMKKMQKMLAFCLTVSMMITLLLPMVMVTPVSAATLVPSNRLIVSGGTFGQTTLGTIKTTVAPTTTTTKASGVVTLPTFTRTTTAVSIIGTPSSISGKITRTTTRPTADFSDCTLTTLTRSEYYGYSLLRADGNWKAQRAYDELYKAFTTYQTSIDLSALSMSTDSAWDAVFAFQADHPELSWMADTYVTLDGVYAPNNHNIKINIDYLYSVEEMESLRAQIKENTAILLEGIYDSMPKAERARLLFDRLREWGTYDQTQNLPNCRNILGILVERIGVCASYALVYQHLLQQCGIPAAYVTCWVNGLFFLDSYEYHAITAMKIDGTWYMADATQGPYGFYPDEAFAAGYMFDDWMDYGYTYYGKLPIPGYDEAAAEQKFADAVNLSEFDIELIAQNLAKAYHDKTYVIFNFVSPYSGYSFSTSLNAAIKDGSLLAAVNRYLSADEQLTEWPFRIRATSNKNMIFHWRTDVCNKI